MEIRNSKILFLLLLSAAFAFEPTQASKLLTREKKQLDINATDEKPAKTDEGSVNKAARDNQEEEDNQPNSPSPLSSKPNKEIEMPFNIQEIRQNKLVSESDASSTALLMDIRNILNQKEEENDHSILQRTQLDQQRLENQVQQTQAKLDAMTEELQRYREFTAQKISLVLETFSTLKLLVINQDTQVKETVDRLERLEGKASHLETQFADAQTSLEEFKSSSLKFRDEMLVQTSSNLKTDPSDEVGNTDLSDKLEGLTERVNNLENEVSSLKSNVTDLKASSQSMATISLPSLPLSNTTEDQDRCQCDLGGIRKDIINLRKEQLTQKEHIETLTENFTVSNPAIGQRNTTIFRNRLGEVEGSLRDLDTFRREVTTVKEDITTLRNDMNDLERGVIIVGSSGNSTLNGIHKGLCVWPYSRCGSSCYHVQTNKRLSWMASRDYCRTIQGDLASPSSFEDFKNFIGHQRLSRAYSYWIGASDINQEGTWTWVNGNPLHQNSTLWAKNSPSEDITSNCLSFKPNNRFDILATDAECRINRYFICEQERLL